MIFKSTNVGAAGSCAATLASSNTSSTALLDANTSPSNNNNLRNSSKYCHISPTSSHQSSASDSSSQMTDGSYDAGQNHATSGDDMKWCFSQVKGALDNDVTEADIISCVEFNHDGDLLATGDKGGRVVIFQKDCFTSPTGFNNGGMQGHGYGNEPNPYSVDYNVYSTFQSHEAEFDYLKSLEIEEKINKIRWLRRKNPAHFLLSTNDKTIKLWKVSERDKQADGYNLKDDDGMLLDPQSLSKLKVPVLRPMDLMVEASPRRIFANAHTYHINSISVNSDGETYISADDLRINLWHTEITDQSFNIVDIKPNNMEDLTEVITSSEFHPHDCNLFIYSSSKGSIRLCDTRAAALCDKHSKLFEEEEDVGSKSFFSEIITSVSDVKFSHSGRYVMSRDYLTLKIWDLHMESSPVETYNIHEHLRGKLCTLYENDYIFDKFECSWRSDDSSILTGSYNNFFRIIQRCPSSSNSNVSNMNVINNNNNVINNAAHANHLHGINAFSSSSRSSNTPSKGNSITAKDKKKGMIGSCEVDMDVDMMNFNGDHANDPDPRGSGDGSSNNTSAAVFPLQVPLKDLIFEASRDIAKPNSILRPKKVTSSAKRKKDEIFVDCLDFSKRILHSAWHPTQDVIAVAATNNLYIFQNHA